MDNGSCVKRMHEFSLALSLIEAVEQKAKEIGATSVVYIKLRVGMATAVVPEFMTEAFEVAKIGSLAENATLEIELEPIMFSCWKCNTEFEGKDLFSRCPSCGSIGGRVISGDKLIIERVEMEVMKNENEPTEQTAQASFDA